MPEEREQTITRGGLNGGAPAEELVAEAPDAGDAAPAPDEAERLRALAADFEDRWKRATAEFINYKRRTEQERGDLLRGASGSLILELLPVLDDLERALANAPAGGEGLGEAEGQWLAGTRLVERKFRTILERQGLTPIEAVGQPFDPTLHEAVGGSGTVVAQEYQRGYRLHGRVLRPAMVVVGETGGVRGSKVEGRE